LQARLRGDISQPADTVLKEGVESSSASPDMADLARELAEQEVAVGLLGTASGTFEQIEAALDRIDDGSYGFCAECGAGIPPERLEAIPYATLCVGCAAQRESGR
jgi:DnaK suppressor protein